MTKLHFSPTRFRRQLKIFVPRNNLKIAPSTSTSGQQTIQVDLKILREANRTFLDPGTSLDMLSLPSRLQTDGRLNHLGRPKGVRNGGILNPKEAEVLFVAPRVDDTDYLPTVLQLPHLPEPLFSSQEQTVPVGGRLQKFWKVWQDLGADPWVVSTIKHGYAIEFIHQPPLSTTPIFGLNSNHPQVKVEILKMIQKGALEEVLNPFSPGFYSRIFVVPKKTGDLRPVIDLKLLNNFLKPKPFKMETPHSIRRSLKRECGCSQ